MEVFRAASNSNPDGQNEAPLGFLVPGRGIDGSLSQTYVTTGLRRRLAPFLAYSEHLTTGGCERPKGTI